MHDTYPPIPFTADLKCMPLHADIAECAEKLWVGYGRPADRDLAIWLEAEHELFFAAQTADEKNSGPVAAQRTSAPKQAHHTARPPHR